jgi:hypothetical protein
MEPPFRVDLSVQAEEFPLLERLVKTQQAGKSLACAVICELWRLAVALVVPSHVYKWSVNPFANQNPVYSHTNRQYCSQMLGGHSCNLYYQCLT